MPLQIVSIHAPAWGATPDCPSDHLAEHVSIHAPAWGATPKKEIPMSKITVSIHAPAWGATEVIVAPYGPHRFQSTPPHGGRP